MQATSSEVAMLHAYSRAAHSSHDQDTQNGAVLICRDGQASSGANVLPCGVKGTVENLEKPAFYDWVVHAEQSAIFSAIRRGLDPVGGTLYACWAPCSSCARVIVECGLRRVVAHGDMHRFHTAHGGKWDENIHLGMEILEAGGVAYYWWNGAIDLSHMPPVRNGGHPFPGEWARA